MPKQAREEVDVTSALKNILDNYPAGSATLREILQNTDDAGAKKQTFILDARKFESNSLVGKELHVCQGPAIIATNDAYFKPKDWKAIKTILNSSKTQDEASAGKYGLGFRSCYHVTDNPHILSDDKLLILDPHARVEQYQGGVELDTKKVVNKDGEIEREAYEDHFATFSSVLQPDDNVYPGTAIRLPLRLEGFQSKLKSTFTNVSDARKMFRDFIAKELPEAMLFLKNITEIKLLEIDEEGNKTDLAIATIENPDVVASQKSGKHTKPGNISHYPITITMQKGSALPFRSSWIIAQFEEDHNTACGYMTRRLKRPLDDVKAAMSSDKLLPQVALALPVPCIPNFHGRLSTLLPLPIVTGFPVHINAVFALVSSRQNLRNSMDAEAGSREELLVEWNRVIFSEFIPKAWASLLDHLVAEQSPTVNVFEAWPGPVSTKDGDQGYWNPLPRRLLEETAGRRVWPLDGRRSEYSTLNDAPVVVKGERGAPIQALEMCNIALVVVPERVFKIIEESEHKKAILSPQAVYPYLKKNTHALSQLDAPTRKSICDYLVSASQINLLLDLPLIPQVRGKHTSISSRSKHVIATTSEAAMFENVDQTLLAEDCMSAATRQLLLNAGRVRPVGPADVAQYLERQVPTFGVTSLPNISSGVNANTFNWLIKFWSWLDGWEKFDELVNDVGTWSKIEKLHALPLRLTDGRSALRLVGKSAVRPQSLDAETVAALAALEVPVLDGSMSNGPAVRHVSKDPSNVVFILQNVTKNRSLLLRLGQASRNTLHIFFTQQLSNHLMPNLMGRFRNQVALGAESVTALRTLPIFPIFKPGSRRKSEMTFEDAPEGACFVDNSVEVIPSIRGVPFICYDQGRVLHTALREEDVLGEIAVLRKVIVPVVWSQQELETGLLSALVDRLIKRLNELGAATRKNIAELPIVEVRGRASRQCPNRVVDPGCALAGLYDAEDEVLPVGRFAEEGPGSYMSQLRTYQMVRTALSPAAIEERVARISNQSRPMNNRAEKALRLLELLDEYTRLGANTLSSNIVQILLHSAWLPIENTFQTPSKCWDSRWKDKLLCDLVLPQISFTVTSHHLRDCLGWVRVSFTTLQSQLLKVLETDLSLSETSQEKNLDRIEAVLAKLASELEANRLSREDIQSLIETLGDAPWVPTASRNRCVARQSMLEQLDLGSKYYPVAPSLLRFSGMEKLLQEMGISNRPTQASLFSTLQDISGELLEAHIVPSARDELIQTSISILEELRRSIQGSDYESQRILVPTESFQLAPVAEVLYNDMGGDPTCPLSGFQFAHPRISSSLAYDLGIRRMTEEEFSQVGEGVESFHMGEDLAVRIKGVLHDYHIDHSCNEWVANADDAKARSVTFLVDEASFDHESRRVIPGLRSFQSGPALVVHNDGVFTEDDFRGLIKIGQGGKAGIADSIGRFGLGALSFYHFSDVPWVISGKFCMFLDPSQEHLARNRGDVRPSVIRILLSVCVAHFPDQLKPLEGLFGFTSKDECFNGTLFRFPLRTAEQADTSKLSDTRFDAVDIVETVNRFYSYSSQSLFFTKGLTEITALRRKSDLKTSPMWSVRSSRETFADMARTDIDAQQVSIQLQAPHTTSVVSGHWLVTKAQAAMEEFPCDFHPLFEPRRLGTPTFGLAVNLSAEGSISNSRLFATLPLPVSTSLPAHIHATWILAQDRRSIRYDAPDAADQRPLDTLYNEHILKEYISPLYVRTLALVLPQHRGNVRHFWPREVQDGPSRVVATEIHKQMVGTEEAVLLSAQNKPISPSKAIIHLSRKTPAAVRTILAALQVSNYVPHPFFDTSYLKDWGDLRFDTAKEVSRILQDNSAVLKKLWQTLDSKYPAFTFKDILSILEFIVKEGESLEGLPLLLRGDGQLVEFQKSGNRTVFASHRSDLEQLFGASVIISRDLTDGKAQDLAKLNVNVGLLDADGMRGLLASQCHAVTPANTKTVGEADREWHKRLLKFLASPQCPIQLEDVADLPLLPAIGGELVVSFNYAQSGKLWWRSLHEDRSLTTVLLQLDVIEVDVLPGRLQRTEKVDLARILRLFGQLSLSPDQILQKVTSKDWGAFIEDIRLWIQVPYIEDLSPAEFQTLTTLPLFRGIHGTNQLPFVSASQVLMLPNSVALDVIARYLPSETIFAEYSPGLAAILEKGKNVKKSLSFENLLGRLRIPSHLTQDEDKSYFALLELVASYHPGNYDSPLIPDGNRVIRRPNELLDHNVDLFLTAFEGRQELFIHSNFRDLTDRLVTLGVQKDITSQRLLECLRAVDRDAQQGQVPVNRATAIWDYINTGPQEMRQLSFDTVRGLRFLPRQTQRHPSDSDFDAYARELPNVVSLDDLCAPEYEAVVWTQRARFSSLPSAHLKAIYPNLGEPTSADVVNHLVSLVEDVAPKHDQSLILLSNIESVYLWLEKKKNDATGLLGPLSNRPLWLNMDSTLDTWTWRAADQLVFGLTYDVEGRFVARKFLHPYRSLLLDAGAFEYRVADFLPKATTAVETPHEERILARWNHLRQRGVLLDVCFLVEGQVIKAHRGMLAAAMEHFENAFDGTFRESTKSIEGVELQVYEFLDEEVESAFAIQSIVDYAYTGKFTWPSASNLDDANTAKEDLLCLAKLSNSWNEEELESQAVQAIVGLGLIRFDNCNEILEWAEEYQINDLIAICRETRRQNQWV